MTGRKPERSPNPHAAVHRSPHALLHAMLERVTPDTTPAEPVAELQRRVAEITGTAAALFFPSGTMAQQAALRVHAERSGRRTFAAHPWTHLDNWEAQGYAAVHGLRLHPVGDRHELLTTAALTAVREPVAAVVWELPQRDLGGVLPSWDDLVAQTGWARDRGAARHLDGARLWEAQPFYDRPHAEIAGLFDSVYVSLYKGLGGVRGAVLAGDEQLIGEVEVWRRRLGGAIPDAWPLALGALAGLDERVPRMAAYRDHAVAVAAAITAGGRVTVTPDPPQTPLFHVLLPVSMAAATAAADELHADTGVRLFGYVRSSTDPRRCAFEVNVGEPGMAFAPEEVAALVADLVDRAERLG